MWEKKGTISVLRNFAPPHCKQTASLKIVLKVSWVKKCTEIASYLVLINTYIYFLYLLSRLKNGLIFVCTYDYGKFLN